MYVYYYIQYTQDKPKGRRVKVYYYLHSYRLLHTVSYVHLGGLYIYVIICSIYS